MDSDVIALVTELTRRHEELESIDSPVLIVGQHRSAKKRQVQQRVLERVNRTLLTLLVRRGALALDDVLTPIDRVAVSALRKTELGSPEEEGVLQLIEEVAHRVYRIKEQRSSAAGRSPVKYGRTLAGSLPRTDRVYEEHSASH